MDKGSIAYRRFLEGDESGLEQIIVSYKDGLILYLNTLVGNIALAEDLAEDTFVRLFTRRPRDKGTGSFKTWLYTIGRNVAIDYLRHQYRFDQISLEDVSFYGYKYYGFQLYNNGKSAENGGTGNLEIKESTIAIAEGPMFYVTNTSVNVDLEEVKFGFAKDAPLAEVVAGDWGEAGKNGGKLVLNAEQQYLEGDIIVDAISTVKFDMGSKVTYKGAINPTKQGKAAVVMENDSKWTLAADSYLETIEFEKSVEKGIKQISSKGHNIYYNPNNPANAALGGKTYPLKGGGSLLTY